MPYIRMKVTVTGTATNKQDENVPGEYYYDVYAYTTNEERRESVLGQFDNEVPVKVLEDFDFVVSEAPYSDDPNAEEPHGSKTAAETLGGSYEDEPEEDEPEPTFWYLNVYLTDQRYGGPEEGGWWYNAGYPATDLPDVAVCYGPYQDNASGKEAMRTQKAEIQALLEKHNSERRSDISSVLSEGMYIVCQEGHIAQHWPQEKPYYE